MLKQQLSVVCFNVFAIVWPSQLRAALSALFYVNTQAMHSSSMCVHSVLNWRPLAGVS